MVLTSLLEGAAYAAAAVFVNCKSSWLKLLSKKIIKTEVALTPVSAWHTGEGDSENLSHQHCVWKQRMAKLWVKKSKPSTVQPKPALWVCKSPGNFNKSEVKALSLCSEL